jgi:hypothetical protein
VPSTSTFGSIHLRLSISSNTSCGSKNFAGNPDAELRLALRSKSRAYFSGLPAIVSVLSTFIIKPCS